MMTEREVEAYFNEYNVKPIAREVIQRTRHNEPSRLVGTHTKKNMVSFFPSRKMGFSIQSESKSGELAFIIICEYSPEIIEIWDQLPIEYIKKTNKNKQKRKYPYTADFLVLTKNGPKVVEVKSDEELHKLKKKTPEDWEVKNNKYSYLPAKERYKELGLEYEVVSISEFNPIRISNYRLLLSVRNNDLYGSIEIRKAILKQIANKASLTLSELLSAVGIEDASYILKLIEDGYIFCNIDDELLSQPDSAYVSGSKELLKYCKDERSTGHGSSSADPDFTLSRESTPTAAEAERVIKKLKIIESGIKNSSVRRWKKIIQEEKINGVSAFVALLPKLYKSGNRECRLNTAVKKYLYDFIENQFASKIRMSPCKAHVKYVVTAKKNHPDYSPVSRTTFTKYIINYDQVKIAFGRGGARAANAVETPTDVKYRDMRATMPFESAKIDHYNVDIHCVIIDQNGERYVVRPWLTVLRDMYSDAILSFWIGYQAPSSRACAMVLRACVKKHGRLPKEISVDNGAEFKSVYFHVLLLKYSIILTFRPAANPKYAAEIERLFGMFKTQWLAYRIGNVVNYKEARSVSGSHSPYNTAEMTANQFIKEFIDFVKWRNVSISGIKSETPDEILTNSISKYTCSGIKIKYDNEFIIDTAVDVRKYKLDPVRGIHLESGHYWHPELAKSKIKKKNLEVKIEPENPHKIYVMVNNKWVVCQTTNVLQFNTKDPVSKIVESLRVLDAKKLRQLAKQQAEQDGVKIILEHDSKIVSENIIDSIKDCNNTIEEDKFSPFDEMLNLDIDKVDSTKWGD